MYLSIYLSAYNICTIGLPMLNYYLLTFHTNFNICYHSNKKEFNVVPIYRLMNRVMRFCKLVWTQYDLRGQTMKL